MKKSIIYYLFVTALMIGVVSCSKSPQDKAASAVESYLKKNLKNPDSYNSISFSQIDTLSSPDTDTSEDKKTTIYFISHGYEILNSEKEKVKMNVGFYLDKDFNVGDANTKSINGDYGSLTGNAYWKYNDYVGNKADAGAEIELCSLDSIRGNLKYETSADVQGNYKIEKVLSGRYFLIVRSKNATDCPEKHLANFDLYAFQIKQLFGFDIKKYDTQLNELKIVDSLYRKSVNDFPSHGTFSQMDESLAKTAVLDKDKREKAEKIINDFPDEFKRKIKLYTGYSNAFDFSIIHIEERKTENNNTDFGITCI